MVGAARSGMLPSRAAPRPLVGAQVTFREWYGTKADPLAHRYSAQRYPVIQACARESVALALVPAYTQTRVGAPTAW